MRGSNTSTLYGWLFIYFFSAAGAAWLLTAPGHFVDRCPSTLFGLLFR
jgi:hypothetical protein